MSGRWWRAYSRARHDPKLLRLSDKQFRWWFNFVCAAADNGGTLPDHADLSVEFRTSGRFITQMLDDLIGAGLLDHDETGIHPHNWDGLQYKNDISNERVKRFRERKRNGVGNVTEPVTGNESETPSESEAESETEQSRAEEERAFETFSLTAIRRKWPTPRKLDADRRKKLRARLDEHGLDGWQGMLDRAEASQFINTKFPLKFDWILEPKNFRKVIEGNYDAPGSGAPAREPLTL